MNSYNTFTCIIILIINLCFSRYLVYGTELILITNLYLYRSYTDDSLILIQISCRTHTYVSRGAILRSFEAIRRVHRRKNGWTKRKLKGFFTVGFRGSGFWRLAFCQFEFLALEWFRVLGVHNKATVKGRRKDKIEREELPSN